ncbi:MAG: hypothetical protein M1829_006424 [Trizodia sp. TS-e1964]|nr:MAG: hypothetical protein M1829_006424 [Trizodia sp. TS-e1964]
MAATPPNSPASTINTTPVPENDNLPQSTPAPQVASAKKGKAAKKATDPSEIQKLLAGKISQLESDKAGEKDQEAEIEREVKKANRDLSQLLSKMESPLSRIDVVQQKYTELLADMRRLDRDYIKSKKRSDQLQKEKDTGRLELSKTISLKEKLEKLCRELQKENKKLKDENKNFEQNEIYFKNVINFDFRKSQRMLQDVLAEKQNTTPDQTYMELEQLFQTKFSSFFDQYNFREFHFLSILRAKEAELQISSKRYDEQRKMAEAELVRSRGLSAQISTFSQTEIELRSQLNIYVEKFKQVEDTLNNSNDLFLTFRKEMEEMSKKTKRLEKENLHLTRKHDSTNRNILEMAEERTRTSKEIEALKRKNLNLEKLCRGMQDQGRASYGPNDVFMNTTSAVIDDDQLGDTESEFDINDETSEFATDEKLEELTSALAIRGRGAAAPQTPGPAPLPTPATRKAQPKTHVNGTKSGTVPNGAAKH